MKRTMTPWGLFVRFAMKTRIIDASVMASWLFGESRGEEAYRMMDGASLLAPELLPYELSNVALVKSRKHPDQQNKIHEAFHQLFNLDDLKLVTVDFNAVLSLATRKSITTYDASYLYLARALEVPLLTFDQKLKQHT